MVLLSFLFRKPTDRTMMTMMMAEAETMKQYFDNRLEEGDLS